MGSSWERLCNVLYFNDMYIDEHFCTLWTILFPLHTVAWMITRLGWHPTVWGQKASFVHLWNSSWGRRKTPINCVKEHLTSAMARSLSSPSTHTYTRCFFSFSLSLPPSLHLYLSLPFTECTSRKLAKTLGEPACVYHPLNARHVESTACHLNAL